MSLALTGCVSPLVTPNPLETQYKVTNAIHWKDLAERTVVAIPSNVGGPQYRVYVSDGRQDVRFYGIYKRFLEEALYRHNFLVVTDPRTADLILNVTAEPILYDHHGKRLVQYASLWGVGGGGIYSATRHITSIDTGIFAGAATAVALDFAAALNGATRAEIVVSTSLTSRDSIQHFIRTETLYVLPSDLSAFYTPPPPPPPAPVIVENPTQPVIAMHVSDIIR